MSSESADSPSSSEVRVFKPSFILLDFHGTIAPLKWETDTIIPYVKENLKQYLDKNWSNDNVIAIVDKLKGQSFDEHFVLEIADAPLIEQEEESDSTNQYVIETLYKYIIWQMENNRESIECIRLQKMIYLNGYANGHIKTPLFDDVLLSIQKFRENNIKIGIFSSLDESTIRAYLKNTDSGDLTSLFDHIFSSEIGSKIEEKSYKIIIELVKCEPSEILYITDFGQEANAADNVGVRCLMIIRPGNKKIREYYLTRFNTIESFKNLKFVNKSKVK